MAKRTRKIPADTASFHYVNMNPGGNFVGDCLMRSISLATGMSWDDVLDRLVIIAHKDKVTPLDKSCQEKLLKQLGFAKQKQPKKPNGRKLTGAEFCAALNRSFSTDRQIIANIGTHHVVCIKRDPFYGYRVCDTWNSSTRCVGSWWVK